MNFFQIIMSPFIYIIKQTFLLAYNITGDYGTAVILLSFGISLLLLPIFIFIERSKKKDDALKLKMAPLIDEIKRVYKGQERFYYIKTIQRQHNYNSFKAVIPILSLLIQIPFFIAAYQYLESFEPLKNVSFLFIKDLSEPDGLFGAVHFLPVFMTIVNLLTAWFYTKNGNVSERKQMVIVAGIFLVLLFNLPSGLVLYWTMNNVFSFFRLFITNPEVFKGRKKQHRFSGFAESYKHQFSYIKKIFRVITVISVLLQLNWAFQNNFNDILIRILISIIASFVLAALFGIIRLYKDSFKKSISKINIKPVYFFSILFFSVYFYLASIFYFNEANKLLGIIAFLFLIPLQFLSYIYFLRNLSAESNFMLKVLNWILKYLLVVQIFILYVNLNGGNLNLNVYNLNIQVDHTEIYDIILLGLIFSILTLSFVFKIFKIKIYKLEKNHYLLFGLSVLFVLGFIFFWQPLLVYSSSPENFDFPAADIFYFNCKLFLMWLLSLILIYILLPSVFKKIFLYIGLFFAVFSFVSGLVIPFQIGSLQVSRFSEEAELAAPVFYYLIEAGFIVLIFIGLRWVFRKKFFKVTVFVMIVFNLFLIGNSLISSINTGYFFSTLEDSAESKTRGIPFSKDKENILYFLADGFQGWYVQRLTEDMPELKEVFEGFVWYPNSLSISNYTHTSISALFGGFEKTVPYMNSDSVKTTKEFITEAANEFVDRIKDKGYYFSSSPMHYTFVSPNSYDNYIPFWDESWKKWSKEVPLGHKLEVWKKRFYENALFFSVPLCLKPKIYNNTEWLSHYELFKEGKEQDGWKYSYQPYNFIRLLPYISNTEINERSFIYIHDHSLHNPWNTVDDNGKMKNDVTPYETHLWFMKGFTRWIEWMKENDVYDNTKIVIISDHGASWSQFDGEIEITPPDIMKGIDKKKISPVSFWRLNPLLMVKEYNSKGPMKEDWRFMSNADGPAILFNNPDSLFKDTFSRSLPAYYALWESKVLEQKTVKLNKEFIVKDNIFDMKNWEVIK